ncbi:MAG: head GIN domain-containing protein [Pseudomonadota bacterium]
MSIRRRSVSVLAALATAGLLAGTAHAAERSWMVGSFDKIRVSGPINVEVETGIAQSARASGAQNIIDLLDVKVVSRELRVSYKPDSGFRNLRGTTLYVTTPELQAATLRGSGDVKVDDMTASSITLALDGSGDLMIENVEADNVVAAVKGSGDLKAFGSCKDADLALKGSGDLDVSGLECNRANAAVQGSGDIVLTASESVNAAVKGSGDIRVKGDPSCTVAVSGSGDIHC